MSTENKPLVYLAIIILGYIAFVTWWPSTTTWDGEGEVSMFPEGSEAKNYRLPANITVTHHEGFGAKPDIYLVSTATWPNGGYADLDCGITEGEQSLCKDQDGKKYNVEVTKIPDQPDPPPNDETAY